MKYTNIIKIFLFSLWPLLLHAKSSSEETLQKTNAIYKSGELSLRFHAQWNVDQRTREKLHKAYGIHHVTFDKKGNPILRGLSSNQTKRWKLLYNLCMGDGCYYCDASEGSCESFSCGTNNEHCRPYIGSDGLPLCGNECSYYAFKSILLCSDPS